MTATEGVRTVTDLSERRRLGRRNETERSLGLGAFDAGTSVPEVVR
jgi:hypothetical protein